jgi:protein gp37
MGVSVEDQKWANTRIPALLDTPAAVRFISAEPLLGPVRLSAAWVDMPADARKVRPEDLLGIGLSNRLDWVIVGGESGHGARPMHPDWARSLRDQCTAAAVPFLFKQHGEYRPGGDPARAADWITESGAVESWSGPGSTQTAMVRVGKKAAGRELDGRTWDEFPTGGAL